jgi:UDP-N-acetylmuramate dehydrogenase
MIIEENIPLAPRTTLRVGGPARYFAEARCDDDVSAALEFARTRNLPLFVLGGGSNIVIADSGWPGLVLHVGVDTLAIETSGNNVDVIFTAGAGLEWDALVADTVTRNCAGIECLSGIPGSAGGTPVQNVGAYGQEVAQTIESVRALDTRANRIVILSKSNCRFLDIRRAKGMVLVPGDENSRSVGSFFKNPVVTAAQFTELVARAAAKGLQVPSYPAPDAQGVHSQHKVSAGWLIEHSGFTKGFRLNSAAISTKHTLALVNVDNASAADIVRLQEVIQARAAADWGVNLEPEPVFVGFDKSRL